MSVNRSVLVINGPNLNLLGVREPTVYGGETLEQINSAITVTANRLGCNVSFFQSNVEGEIVSAIQQSLGIYDGIIINPAAYTHTSVAIRDAIAAVGLPVIEVHLSNVYKREEFRHKSYIAPVAVAQIAGFGANGYSLALKGLLDYLNKI